MYYILLISFALCLLLSCAGCPKGADRNGISGLWVEASGGSARINITAVNSDDGSWEYWHSDNSTTGRVILRSGTFERESGSKWTFTDRSSGMKEPVELRGDGSVVLIYRSKEYTRADR